MCCGMCTLILNTLAVIYMLKSAQTKVVETKEVLPEEEDVSKLQDTLDSDKEYTKNITLMNDALKELNTFMLGVEEERGTNE